MFSSWRQLVFFWNLWGAYGDIFDKLGVYITFTALTGIGAGAHGAFTTARAYVAVSSFLATFVPLISNGIVSFQERLLRNDQNVINQNVFSAIVQLVFTLPYFAAAFVRTDRATRILYWIPAVAQTFIFYFTMMLYRRLHRNREGYTRAAVSIARFAFLKRHIVTCAFY